MPGRSSISGSAPGASAASASVVVRWSGTSGLPSPSRSLTMIGRSGRARYKAPPPGRGRAGTPDVLVILLDDVGFGASSAFGGSTPTAQRLADGGFKYTRH